MAPSTFASAAASGSNPNSSRADGASEWTRRANGATQTFRRTSQATTSNSVATSAPRETTSHSTRNSTESAGVYIPPHFSATRNGAGHDQRYSKDLMLSLFNAQQGSNNLLDGVSDLYVNGWAPTSSNGVSSASWGRRDEHKEGHGTDLCWDRNANMFPLNLHDMTEEEKDLFSGSVNSPVKPPTLTNKDGSTKEPGPHRKTSISQSLNSPGAFGLSSPTQARPGNRRRDTSEAYPFPSPSITSPSASRFSKEELGATNPPAALLRRRTEQKESISESTEERDRDKVEPAPTGTLKRSATGGLGAPGSSAWGSSGATNAFSPMGAFGNFALGNTTAQPLATEKKPGYGSVRGQSRFAGLMKDALGEQARDVKEKPSISDLNRQSEQEQEQNWQETRQMRPYSDDTDPFPDQNAPTGSAALGGGVDLSPPKQRGFGAFGASRPNDDGGLSLLGMNSDNIGHHDFSHQTPQHQSQQRGDHSHEPMSPTNTNPYQSPENERTDFEDHSHDSHEQPTGLLPGLGGFRQQQPQGLPGLGSNFPAFGSRLPAAYEAAASDRSQTSSTGPSRGFPSLSGLGGLGGLGGHSPWSAGPQALGTPTRDRSGFGHFGDNLMSSAADSQSPVLAGLGGPGAFGGSAFGTGRSKMGSLFPASMQEQMRLNEGGPGSSEDQAFEGYPRQQGFGSLRGNFGGVALGSNIPARDSESPFRNNRGMFEDLMQQTPRGEAPNAIGEHGGLFGQGLPSASGQTPLSSVPSQDPLNLARKSQSNLQRQSSGIASPSSSQPPLQQMRTMVMPDRMKWIYKDPQGSTQGPWSGLEMHDWYRAGFFTPELLIKRVEDPEFEPLAQLIRRIGNSREPFLVPQIGVPHEPTATNKVQPGPTGSQPPFPNSFPSFGTTLTAEQQNALERRKQEEQFLMARQKEHLAQQQHFIKQQGGIGGQPHGLIGGQLHHHSSAHSLHSQPSFGSVTSPAAYQPSPTQGPILGGQPVPGFFDNSFRAGPAGANHHGLEMEMPGMMERLHLNRGAQQQSGAQLPLGQGLPGDMHSQQIASMLQDRARLQHEQAEHDKQNLGSIQDQHEASVAHDRLQQFHELRAAEQAASDATNDYMSQQNDAYSQTETEDSDDEIPETLTQQVQAASAAKQASAQQSPWAKIDPAHAIDLSQRPPQSASPMPAPVAQRKNFVADTLVAESRSQTQSPAVETPTTSLAPWAQQTVEHPKTQSLKEIQEAEARRAAKQEELAAAHRRAAMEREMAAAQAAANVAPAPGLPTGATWASQSPAAAAPVAGPAPWSTKTSTKPGSKTLQQIQKEEEAKKQRAAVAAASAIVQSATPTSSGGKRYADLASKTAAAAAAVPAGPPGSWTTVGAGGKVKAPIASPPVPSPGRTVSGTVATVAGNKPLPVARSTTMGSAQMSKLTKADALSEFKKWAISELQRGGLDSGINASDFIDTLLVIGSEPDIITEAVHGSAQTIDSRHFAEEFVRRKKQADKGIVEPSTTASPSNVKPNENAWSAVAKKGQQPVPAAATTNQEFKVAKPKGRRK